MAAPILSRYDTGMGGLFLATVGGVIAMIGMVVWLFGDPLPPDERSHP